MNASTDIVARTVETVRAIAVEHEITVTRVIVYGSQARGESGPDSDVDLVIVSPDWEGVDPYARPHEFLLDWPRDELPVPDIIPITPTELDERRQDEYDIVRTAAETGVAVAL